MLKISCRLQLWPSTFCLEHLSHCNRIHFPQLFSFSSSSFVLHIMSFGITFDGCRNWKTESSFTDLVQVAKNHRNIHLIVHQVGASSPMGCFMRQQHYTVYAGPRWGQEQGRGAGLSPGCTVLLLSCSSTVALLTVFATLFCTAVEMATSNPTCSALAGSPPPQQCSGSGYGLFSLHGSERVDKLFISTQP